MDELLPEVPPAFVVPTVVDALLDPDRAAAFFASAEPGADAVAALAVIDPAVFPMRAGLICWPGWRGRRRGGADQGVGFDRLAAADRQLQGSRRRAGL